MTIYKHQETIASGGEYIMPQKGYVMIGAEGGDITVSIEIDGQFFNFETVIVDGTAKTLENVIPAGAKLTFTGGSVKIMAYA